LADRKHYLPSRLSGGQRQRVAIARALVNQPALVLADEPTAALEAHSTDVVMDLLRELTVGPSKTTVLIVTHDQRLIDRADRIVNMVGGRIISNVRTRESIRICSALSKNPELADLHVSPGTLTRIAERMSIEDVSKGTTVVREGTTGDRYYLIGEGTAEARKAGNLSRSLKVNDFFGEVTSFSGMPNPETVVASTHLELFVLPHEDLEQVLKMDESLEEKLRRAYMARQ
jgi:putative ABC transport system ATP-binding protein